MDVFLGRLLRWRAYAVEVAREVTKFPMFGDGSFLTPFSAGTRKARFAEPMRAFSSRLNWWWAHAFEVSDTRAQPPDFSIEARRKLGHYSYSRPVQKAARNLTQTSKRVSILLEDGA